MSNKTNKTVAKNASKTDKITAKNGIRNDGNVRGSGSDTLAIIKRLGVVVAVIVVALLFHAVISRPHARGGDIGPLGLSCKKVPDYAIQNNVPKPAFDTSRKDKPGLVMFDSEHPEKAFQPPSWKSAGNLGPLVVDSTGNVFVAPVPNINTLTNPPDKQNTISRVDTATGIMSEYFTLQNVGKPNQTNPYGIVSLAYDCETGVLYAGTISGSTIKETNGSIVAIDTTTKKEISRINHIDALSVGLFRDKSGAHLYYGPTNRSEVWRVGLALSGSIVGKPTKVFSYDDFNELKPRKLVFTDPRTMQIHTTEFRYNLIASTEFRQKIITYKYSADKDTWTRSD